MTELRLENINLKIGNKNIIEDLNLKIESKDFFVFLGPSGCGKTTTLRIIAGLVQQTSGDVIVDGKVINDLSPSKRELSLVFQDYALYPHKTVFENIAFPLRIARKDRQHIIDKVKEVSSFLAIEHILGKKPSNISGGERQRVAIARALVKNPKLLLMDEPLSNLDAKLRDTVRFELKKIHNETGITTIYVTHDQLEAMTLGTKIAVMNGGKLIQTGTPMNVFEEPLNSFVASFIGSPPMNILSAPETLKEVGAKSGSIGVRPRAVAVTHDAKGGEFVELTGRIEGINLLGNEALVLMRINGESLYFSVRREQFDQISEGKMKTVYVEKNRVYLFDENGQASGRLKAEDYAKTEIFGN